VQAQGHTRWNSVPVSRWCESDVASKAAVRAEVMSWGLGDSHVDPGEVLLRFVTQSAARAERYAQLLQEAFEAAERLKQAHTAGALDINEDDEMIAETARRDLDRIFNTRGVAALVGHTTEPPRTSVFTSPVRRYVGLLILKRRNVIAAQTSPPRPLLLGLRNAPYGWPSDKAS
jgi:hypothetical protein